MTSDEIKHDAAQIVKAGLERNCSPDVIAQAVYDRIRLSDPMLSVLSEIAAQLAYLNQNIRAKELKAEVNLYESQAERKDLA